MDMDVSAALVAASPGHPMIPNFAKRSRSEGRTESEISATNAVSKISLDGDFGPITFREVDWPRYVLQKPSQSGLRPVSGLSKAFRHLRRLNVQVGRQLELGRKLLHFRRLGCLCGRILLRRIV